MKIRDKLFFGFGLYLLFAMVFGALAYKALNTIRTHLLHLEIADDITNTLLEVRRYEKNYLLYGDQGSLEEIWEIPHGTEGRHSEDTARGGKDIGEHRVSQMLQLIAEYEHRIGILGEIRGEQERLRRFRREWTEKIPFSVSKQPGNESHRRIYRDLWCA